jgi:hypothetical protein
VEYAAKKSTKNEKAKTKKSDVPAKKQSTTKATTTATERQMILHHPCSAENCSKNRSAEASKRNDRTNRFEPMTTSSPKMAGILRPRRSLLRTKNDEAKAHPKQ